jgi:hypothetical protein
MKKFYRKYKNVFLILFSWIIIPIMSIPLQNFITPYMDYILVVFCVGFLLFGTIAYYTISCLYLLFKVLG